jgi:DNA/RNA-binding domain of Phe-tRNA-synthetase-like protein
VVAVISLKGNLGGFTMKLVVADSIRAKYPDLRIGVAVAKNVNNSTYKDGLEDNVKSAFSQFSNKFEDAKDIESQKNIVAWREIYRSFGINPKKKKPTAESLLARVLRSNYTPHISPAVDAYLCAETAHCLPIGGYDLECISGDIVLRFSSGNEDFFGVGAESAEVTNEGEVVYADDERILTRCWNYRDNDHSKIDDGTNMLALFSEAPLAEITDDEVKETVEQISANLQRYCGAECSVLFLSANENEIAIL